MTGESNGESRSRRRKIEADHVGEDDEIGERDLALQRAEPLLEQDAPADGFNLTGVDQPDQLS